MNTYYDEQIKNNIPKCYKNVLDQPLTIIHGFGSFKAEAIEERFGITTIGELKAQTIIKHKCRGNTFRYLVKMDKEWLGLFKPVCIPTANRKPRLKSPKIPAMVISNDNERFIFNLNGKLIEHRDKYNNIIQ